MSVLRRAKLRTPDGTESIEYPLGVEAENVEVTNQENLSQRLVRIDEDLEKNEAKADQAILDSATAQNTANSASTSASNANTKIDGASIVGEYTSGTETLEILLELGEIQQKGE